MLPLHEILLRLTVAATLGAIIGIERDLRRRPAGIRTSLFVCLATALFTILSGEIAHRFGATICRGQVWCLTGAAWRGLCC